MLGPNAELLGFFITVECSRAQGTPAKIQKALVKKQESSSDEGSSDEEEVKPVLKKGKANALLFFRFI